MSTADDDYEQARQYLRGLLNTGPPQTSSCLSVNPHGLKDPRDLRSHFFGCLGYDERIKVLGDEHHPIWGQLAEVNREDYANDDEFIDAIFDENPHEVRHASALNLQAEIRRIAILRRTAALSKPVRDLGELIESWWKEKKKNGIRNTSDTRVNLQTSREQPRPSELIQPAEEHPQPSVNRDQSQCPKQEVILPEFSKKLRDIIDANRAEKTNPEEDKALNVPGYDLKRDVKARFIGFKRPDTAGPHASSIMNPVYRPTDDKGFKGTFPDHQVSMHRLLKEKFKRLDTSQGKPEERARANELRYFHIPNNNMEWVEEAMASYFDEEYPSPSPIIDPQTQMILNERYWKGRELGGSVGSAVHDRHLRPTCEKITTGGKEQHLVLFMPFLHWETDRMRSQATNLIEKLTDEHDLDKRETAKILKIGRKKDQDSISSAEDAGQAGPSENQEPDYYGSHNENRDKVFQELARMLSEKLGPVVCEDESGLLRLVHILRKTVNDEEHSNSLLMALKRIIEELDASRVPETLRPLLGQQDSTHHRRDWLDILWQLKRLARGRRTPHALDDIFWEAIKMERTQADDEKGEKPGNAASARGSFRSRNIFQKPTEIFRGVAIDEDGVLQPKSPLARIFVQAARIYEQMATYADRQILKEYLFKQPPIHPRRTLDQAYSWRLHNTRLRDRDQVVYRHTHAEFTHKYRLQRPSDSENDEVISISNGNPHRNNFTEPHTDSQVPEKWAWTRHGQYEEVNGCDQCAEDIKKVSRVVMADQLWLWVLDRNTILTCFPQRYGVFQKDPSGVHQSIRTRVRTRIDPGNHIKSIFDLALIILEACFSTFFSRTKSADARPEVLDIFAESIGRVANKQAVAFKHLWRLSERHATCEVNVDSSLLNALPDIRLEADSHGEIRDIIDELDIVMHIVHQQHNMITRFRTFAVQIMESEISDMGAQASVPEDDSVGNDISKSLKDVADKALQEKLEFDARAEVLLGKVEDRIKKLQGLKSSAGKIAENVDTLLGLIQQQASAIQAYEATKQGEETVNQGRAIMVFTVMTIIFLPLSFMTSVFGMNNVEESGGSDSSGSVPGEIVNFWPTTFSRQMLIMFMVSFVTVLAVFIPAFSSFTRAIIHYAFAMTFTKAITWTKLYEAWLKLGWDSKQIRNKANKNVRRMKEEAKERLHRELREQSEIQDGVRSPDGQLRSKRTAPVSPPKVDSHEMPKVVSNGAAARFPPDVEMGIPLAGPR